MNVHDIERLRQLLGALETVERRGAELRAEIARIIVRLPRAAGVALRVRLGMPPETVHALDQVTEKVAKE